MAVDPGKDSTHCLLHDCKVEVSKRNSFPAFGDNAATNSDGLIDSNKIIVNEAVVKPEVVESAENIDDLDEQSKHSAGNDNSESFKIESLVRKVPVQQEGKAKKIKLENEESVKKIVTREGNKYRCVVCTGDNQVSRNNIHSIAAHLRRKHNLCFYICDICRDYFRNETDLSQHMKDHVAKKFNFECDVCIRIFTRLQLLCPDKKAHHRHSEKFWPCPNCCKDYDTKRSLKKHIKKSCTEKEPFICRGCDTCKDDIIIKHMYEPGELEAQMLEIQEKVNIMDLIRLFETSYRDKLDKESLLDYNDHYYNAKFGGKKIIIPPLEKMKKKIKKVSISETPLQVGNKNIDIQFALRDGNRYTCLICRGDNKESRDAKDILAHLKEEHDFSFDICAICRKYFRKRTDLISICYNNLSPQRDDIDCKKCLDTCSRLQLFRIHKHFHYTEKRMMAMLCGAHSKQMDHIFA